MLGLIGIEPIHTLNTQESRVLLAVLGRTHQPAYQVTLAQSKPADLRSRDVDVMRTGEESLPPEKAKSIVGNIKHAGAGESTLLIYGFREFGETLLVGAGGVKSVEKGGFDLSA